MAASKLLYREPVSILAILQLPLLLLGIVPVVLYSGSLELQFSCFNAHGPFTISTSWGFFQDLFRVDKAVLQTDPCHGSNNTTWLVGVDVSRAAVSFVAVLSLGLLWSLLGLAAVHCCWAAYASRERLANLASLDLALQVLLSLATAVVSALWIPATLRLHTATSPPALQARLALLVPCQSRETGAFEAAQCPVRQTGWWGAIYALYVTAAAGLVSALLRLLVLLPIARHTPCGPKPRQVLDSKSSKQAPDTEQVVYAVPSAPPKPPSMDDNSVHPVPSAPPKPAFEDEVAVPPKSSVEELRVAVMEVEETPTEVPKKKRRRKKRPDNDAQADQPAAEERKRQRAERKRERTPKGQRPKVELHRPSAQPSVSQRPQPTAPDPDPAQRSSLLQRSEDDSTLRYSKLSSVDEDTTLRYSALSRSSERTLQNSMGSAQASLDDSERTLTSPRRKKHSSRSSAASSSLAISRDPDFP